MEINAKDKNGLTPMHWATLGGRIEVMKWLKEQGVDINAKDGNGATFMHAAAFAGRVEAMKWLKEQGADINAENNEGKTPLSVAQKDETKAWLRANGAK